MSLLTSYPDAVDRTAVERKEKNGKKVKMNCPKAMSTYTKNMGFMDKFDPLKSLYEVDRKNKKWWSCIFLHLLYIAVINSYILSKILTDGEKNTVKQLRLALVYSL